MVTDEYGNKYEDKIDGDSIQQPIYKIKLNMGAVWTHRHNWQRKHTRRTSNILWELLFLIKNVTKNNEMNQKN